MPNQDCTTIEPAQLAAQARTAYEQKRTRECIELIKALESADPGNEAARALQATIQADMRRDLDDARALLEQSSTDDGTKYRRAAELILLKLLRLDPENQEAKALMQTVRPGSTSDFTIAQPRATEPHRFETPSTPEPISQPIIHSTASKPEPVGFRSEPIVENESEYEPEAQLENSIEAPRLTTPTFPSPTQREDVPFTAAVLLETKGKNTSGRKIPVGLIAVIALAGVIWLFMHSRRSGPSTLAAPAKSESSKTADFPARATPPPSLASVPAPAPAAPVSSNTVAPPPAPSVPAATAATAAAVNNATPTTGKLAVSSATAAEIYIGNKYVASTPTTLDLPVGRQTVEYRHGDLKTTLTHDIKANQTITATVTFQMTVQVNAKPWAQVFLDGNPRRPLGQTPLSGVTVPIGGVLVFENPSFASKSYRITDKDTSIQVEF